MVYPLLKMLHPLSTMVKGKEVVGLEKERPGYFQSKGGAYPLKQIRYVLVYVPVEPQVPFSVLGGFLREILASSAALESDNPAAAIEPLPAALGLAHWKV